MQVIVHHREPAYGDGENLRKFLESVFDPLFRLPGPSPSRKARRTQRDAVVPTGYGGVNEVRTSHCHRWNLQGYRRSLPSLPGFVKSTLHVLCLRTLTREMQSDQSAFPGL